MLGSPTCGGLCDLLGVYLPSVLVIVESSVEFGYSFDKLRRSVSWIWMKHKSLYWFCILAIKESKINGIGGSLVVSLGIEL